MEEIIIIGYQLLGLFLLVVLAFSIFVTTLNLDELFNSIINLNNMKTATINLENKMIRRKLYKKKTK